jgi:hypothetical protein
MINSRLGYILGPRHVASKPNLFKYPIWTSPIATASISMVSCTDLTESIHLYISFLAASMKRKPDMPHPMRKAANGAEVVVIFMPLWVDDVSGNRSKQYNPHMNVCALNWNLPGQLLHQEYFVHFVSTSSHASALEQLSAVMDCVK